MNFSFRDLLRVSPHFFFRVNLHNIINTNSFSLSAFLPPSSAYCVYLFILMHYYIKNKFTENGINVNVYFFGAEICVDALSSIPPFFLVVCACVWVSVSVRS